MKVHTYERAFLAVSSLVMIGCLAALLYATQVGGMHLPGVVGQVDPARVYQTEPFNHPGVRQTGPSSYDVVLVAQAWAFSPAEIHVPVGTDVTFYGTSVDVIHGFEVAGTRLNMMLVPGQISRATYRFSAPGEHLLVCHEYCGLGHQTMSGRIVVE